MYIHVYIFNLSNFVLLFQRLVARPRTLPQDLNIGHREALDCPTHIWTVNAQVFFLLLLVIFIGRDVKDYGAKHVVFS